MPRILIAPLPLVGSFVALLGLAVLAGCNDDGRELRPAKPDQTASVSTTAPPATSETGFDIPTTLGTLPGDIDPDAPATPDDFTVTAPWRDGTVIPGRYTCDGDDIAPALSWSGGPLDAAEIAISVVDDDAPDFVHWTVIGLDPTTTRLAEGEIPLGAGQGTNGAGTIGWSGPCPPAGGPHTYRFTVHYLDQQLDLGDGADGLDLLVAIDAATIASGDITGIYSRP